MVALFSFFSGAGFLDLGFETRGYDVKFTNENSPAFAKAYVSSRQKLGYPLPEYGNYVQSIELLLQDTYLLANLIRRTRREHDIIGFIGGPPCPDFSIGGRNRGRHGDNGILSATYVETIIRHQPDFFLFENVKGLWRTKRHRKFYDELKQSLIESNYILTDKLINAIEYGVPQDRERIILIGFHQNFISDLDYTINGGELPHGLFPWDTHTKYSQESVLALPWPTTKPFIRDEHLEIPPGIIEELTVQHWFDRNIVDVHPNSNHYFQPRAGKTKMELIDEGDDSKKSYKRLHRWRYSPTVAYGNNEVHLHPYKVRRLSSAEAMALQSLPSEFELPEDMTLTSMFKTIGNGVPYLLALGLASSILEFMEIQNEYLETVNTRFS